MEQKDNEMLNLVRNKNMELFMKSKRLKELAKSYNVDHENLKMKDIILTQKSMKETFVKVFKKSLNSTSYWIS